MEAGLDDNQAALIKIAEEDTPEAQLRKLEEMTASKKDGAAKTSASGSKGKLGRSTWGRASRTRKKRLPAPGTESLITPAPSDPAQLLSGEEKEELARLLKLWNDADELKGAFGETSLAVQTRFTEKILASDELDEDETDDAQSDDDTDQQEDDDGNSDSWN